MKPLKDIIQAPIFTEKASDMRFSINQYVFKVGKKATKFEIKRAIEIKFNVIVESVNTLNVSGKLKRVRKELGRTASWKKAIVRLREGDKISEFEGV